MPSTQVNNVSSSSGIGFTGALTIVFIVLKLLHKIDWSWIWVLAPAWIGVGVVIMFVVGLILAVKILDR